MKYRTHDQSHPVILALLSTAFVLPAVGCTMSSPADESQATLSSGETYKLSAQSQFVAGQLLVKFRNNVSRDSAKPIILQHGASILRDYSDLQLYLIALPDSMSVEQGMEIFNRVGEIEFAEPNHIYKSED